MAEAYGIGDIVRLKSGSLDMVVEGFEPVPGVPATQMPDRLIRTVWMLKDGTIQSHVFAQHLLTGVKEDKPDPVVKRDPMTESDPLFEDTAAQRDARFEARKEEQAAEGLS
jgi:hypothetical protein